MSPIAGAVRNYHLTSLLRFEQSVPFALCISWATTTRGSFHASHSIWCHLLVLLPSTRELEPHKGLLLAFSLHVHATFACLPIFLRPLHGTKSFTLHRLVYFSQPLYTRRSPRFKDEYIVHLLFVNLVDGMINQWSKSKGKQIKIEC